MSAQLSYRNCRQQNTNKYIKYHLFVKRRINYFKCL